MTQPRRLGLLCYLALARPRGLQSRDRLIDLLWPDHDAARGRQALRNALHGARQRLGESAIISVGDQLVGLNESVIGCDALDLERGVRSARDPGPMEGEEEPMAGLHVSHAPEFDHWLSTERERLRALVRRHADARWPAAPAAVSPAPGPYALDARILHARGHYLFLRTAHGGSVDDLLRSRDYLERALALDETFAPALAGLANFYAVAARRGILTPFDRYFGLAIDFSERALALDPGLAAPHVHFAVKALYLEDDFDRAGLEFETAVRVDPSYAEGHRFYGVWLGLAGRHAEALEHMEHAVALEPDVPHFLSSLGAARLAVGDRDGAEEALRRTLQHDRTHVPARRRLIRLLEDDGRLEAAVQERERPPALPDAAGFRAACEAGPVAYAARVAEGLRSEIEEIELRLSEGAPAPVEDLFSPAEVRLVELYARLGDIAHARRVAREARVRRPGLGPWLDAVLER